MLMEVKSFQHVGWSWEMPSELLEWSICQEISFLDLQQRRLPAVVARPGNIGRQLRNAEESPAVRPPTTRNPLDDGNNAIHAACVHISSQQMDLQWTRGK
jgi:hypothetical protein